jgi:hypothetical protein
MSFYNLMNGVNHATYFALPMLGKHPEEYPRFRDCFVGKLSRAEEKDQFGIPLMKLTTDSVLSVFTRVGGSNRGSYEKEIEELRSVPEYIEDYDDSFDSTFAVFVFSVPERWKVDFNCMFIKSEEETAVSDEYLAELKRVYPKLADQFQALFRETKSL